MALRTEPQETANENSPKSSKPTAKMRVETITALGMMTAAALVASYLETLLPVFVAVPGIKLGLANAVTMFLLYRAGVKPAATVSLLRICLSSVLFGGLFSAVYSLAGAVFSMTAMVLLKRTKAFGTVGVSAVGGVMHNLGQIIAAVFLVENEKIVFYLPVLSAAGVVSGVVIGVLTGILLQKMPSKFY